MSGNSLVVSLLCAYLLGLTACSGDKGNDTKPRETMEVSAKQVDEVHLLLRSKFSLLPRTDLRYEGVVSNISGGIGSPRRVNGYKRWNITFEDKNGNTYSKGVLELSLEESPFKVNLTSGTAVYLKLVEGDFDVSQKQDFLGGQSLKDLLRSLSSS